MRTGFTYRWTNEQTQNRLFQNSHRRHSGWGGSSDDLFIWSEVFTAVTMKDAVFWNVEQSTYCENRRFGGTCLLHLQEETRSSKTPVPTYLHGATSQKKAFSMISLIPTIYIWQSQFPHRVRRKQLMLCGRYVHWADRARPREQDSNLT
jgi:hypothetical protein